MNKWKRSKPMHTFEAAGNQKASVAPRILSISTDTNQ